MLRSYLIVTIVLALVNGKTKEAFPPEAGQPLKFTLTVFFTHAFSLSSFSPFALSHID